MEASSEVDVLIAGGGPVGVTLAHALAPLQALGASVLHVANGATPDDRPISLSWGSRLLLERLGLWSALPATPILRIHVSQQRRFGRTLISAEDHKVEALGYVVSYADLCHGLPAATVQRAAGRLEQWTREQGHTVCRVTEGGASRTVSARLLVLADGGRERAPQSDQEFFFRDYGQSAVVCTLRASQYQPGTAWERFTPEGPVALLPFNDRAGAVHDRAGAVHDRLALVWSSRTATAQELLGLPDTAFLARLQQAFGGRLGMFSEPGPRRAFPLSLRYRRDIAQPGVIAIGNAAQALHPVAAQGLNLGLRDAWELAELLCEGEEPGADTLARRYAQRRRVDRRIMTRLTDGLVGVFNVDWPLAGAARGAALALLDAVPPARRLLSRRMMFGARGFP